MGARSLAQAKIFARDAVEKWIWRRIAQKPGFGDLGVGACIVPIVRLRHAKSRALNYREKACLRTLVVGGEWLATRLARAGLLESECCLRCGQVGDLSHRHVGCDGVTDEYRKHDPEGLETANAGKR